MTVELLTKLHLELFSSIVGGTGSSESTLVKMPHCWKSHVTVYLLRKTIEGYLDSDPSLTINAINT